MKEVSLIVATKTTRTQQLVPGIYCGACTHRHLVFTLPSPCCYTYRCVFEGNGNLTLDARYT